MSMPETHKDTINTPNSKLIGKSVSQLRPVSRDAIVSEVALSLHM